MNKLKSYLNMLNITFNELVQELNTAGGRDPNQPIIYAETCENPNCQNRFISTTQDHFMRKNNGYQNLCPSCREIDRREKKRLYAQRSRKLR